MERIEINGKSYLIDIEKATEQGLLKEKPNKPMSWEEYAEVTLGVLGYGASLCYNDKYGNKYDVFKNIEEARAFNALGKLIQLRDAWWGDWRPVWSENEEKYGICATNNAISKGGALICQFIFVFPTEEMRDEFFNTFYDLIEQAKMFL